MTAPFALHMAANSDRWWALLAIAAGPIAWVVRRRPVLAASLLIVGATILRMSFVGLSSSDQPLLSELAAARAFAGLDPYGATVYASGSAYAYGPLGLLWYQGGIPVEILATLATSAVLVWARAWMTLAFYNAWPQFLFTPAIGYNDFSVGFLMALAVVVIRFRPKVGMVLLAMAIAIKPYAAAWFLPAVGYVGFGAAMVVGLIVLMVLWSPVFVLWGVPSFLASVRQIDADRAIQASLYPNWSWSFADVPVLRLLVLPLSLLGLVLRSWVAMVWLGAAGFVVFLGFSPWAHVAYLAAALPIIGLAVEWRPGRGEAE